ncbi:MAG: LTA synthase family protein [Clostridia bacterium]|nr:LTA synthase family protein [Clostridia bacterium]
MFTILYLLIIGALASFISHKLSPSPSSSVQMLIEEILFNSLILFLLLYVIFIYSDRLIVDTTNGFQVIIGRFPYVIGIFASLVLGWVQSGVNQKTSITLTERKTHFGIFHILSNLFFILLSILTFAYIWAKNTYSNISLDMVVFYLRMPLKGTANSFFLDLNLYIFGRALSFIFLLLLLCALPLRKTRAVFSVRQTLSEIIFHQYPIRISLKIIWLILGIWLAILLVMGNSLLDFTGFIDSRIHSSTFIEEHYVKPDISQLAFPERKRNLITLYIESCETTTQDPENGGAFTPSLSAELTEIAKNNISFSQSDLIQGAAIAPACGWTIAGMVAQTAGIPLKYYVTDDSNIGDRFQQFLPGAVTLGDILNANGYHCVFMAGSDFEFGGRRQLYTDHGEYEILDIHDAAKRGIPLPSEESGDWGILDKDLYAWAKEELLVLAKEKKPFHLALLTLDTHHPTRECDLCPTEFATRTANIIACTSRQAKSFVDWCMEQSFMENTTIVITGDHASMLDYFFSSFIGEFDKMNGSQKRLVYNAFINPIIQPVSEKNRMFTTIDFFPSVLASIGVRIPGEQLGLGVNLFSGYPTLSEQFGYDLFFDELNRKSSFYDNEILFPQ